MSSRTTRKTTRTANGISRNVIATDTNRNKDDLTVLAKSSQLPYQYRGDLNFKSSSGCLSISSLSQTHRTMRLGLGPPLNNLKPQHIVNSKRQAEIVLPSVEKNVVSGYTKSLRDQQCLTTPKQYNSSSGNNTTPGGDPGTSITSRMKLLTIYESPKASNDESNNCTKREPLTVFQKAFNSVDKKGNLLRLGQKVTYNFGHGKKLVVLPTASSDMDASVVEDNNQAVSSLCRHFRNLLGWKMSLHCNWKYIEERCKLWPSNISVLSLDDVANILKISPENLKLLRISADLEIIFDVLRKSLCHVNLPNIARILALSKIQEGKPELAARFLSECNGMYLHSEIVDKHLTFIRRIEEAVPDVKGTNHSLNEAKKCEMFWLQAQQTLDFSNDCFDINGEKCFKSLTSFDPDWNVVHVTTSIQSSNRFGSDLVGTRKVPHLFLSVFGYLPHRIRKQDRSHFTTCCPNPLEEPGSMMRHGIVEEFEKLMDKNLMISDEKVLISRRKYWEERARHNESIEAIMEVMQDWIYPWMFLFPGTIVDKLVQDKIVQEVLSSPVLKGCTDTQKFLIYRMTENYMTIPQMLQDMLYIFVSLILQVDENRAEVIARKISQVGYSIDPDSARNPTVLILDQDIEILPWDWLRCLRTTSVTRMPSLNLMVSTKKLWDSLEGDYRRTIDSANGTVVLNPDGSLPQVQTRLEQYFKDRKSWTSIVARPPTTNEMQTALENQDLFVYCGHGAGANFYPEYAIQKLLCKAVPILMGCSSAQSHFAGPRLYGNSFIHAYFIAGCSSVVGFLWEITDTECDRMTVELLERWVPDENAMMPRMPMFDSSTKREVDKNLVDALRKSRKAATQLMTECAAVCYGLPITCAK